MASASALRTQWSQSFAPADRTLPAMLTRQAERFAQKPLVTAGDTTWTYAAACEAAARFAGTLRSAGIKAEDRVAIICSNRIEFLETLLGCAWLGAIAVPINVASRGPQLQHILANCGARLLVMEGAYAENLTLSRRIDACRRSHLADRPRCRRARGKYRRDTACRRAANKSRARQYGPATRR